jgi:hypothetical protein
MALFHFSWFEWLLALNILFWSHFAEDTYVPVYLWAKYIRRPPEMTNPRKGEVILQQQADGGFQPHQAVMPPDPKAGFVDFIATPMGKILMIAIDQIIHICFLLPIAWMLMLHLADDL